MKKPTERQIITDKVVVAKTGKTMEEWFEFLDKKGAKKMKHTDIIALVAGTAGLKPLGQWNQNLLATSYEWSRKLKERGEKKNGFEISVSKTVSVPIDILYQAWTSDKERNRWLKENNVVIRKATENKSVRITWSDQSTSLSVDFYPKGVDKTQVVVQHLKLPNSKKASRMKEYWAKTLEGLKSLLEN